MSENIYEMVLTKSDEPKAILLAVDEALAHNNNKPVFITIRGIDSEDRGHSLARGSGLATGLGGLPIRWP